MLYSNVTNQGQIKVITKAPSLGQKYVVTEYRQTHLIQLSNTFNGYYVCI